MNENANIPQGRVMIKWMPFANMQEQFENVNRLQVEQAHIAAPSMSNELQQELELKLRDLIGCNTILRYWSAGYEVQIECEVEYIDDWSRTVLMIKDKELITIEFRYIYSIDMIIYKIIIKYKRFSKEIWFLYLFLIRSIILNVNILKMRKMILKKMLLLGSLLFILILAACANESEDGTTEANQAPVENTNEESESVVEEASIQDEVDKYIAKFKEIEDGFNNAKVVDLQNFYYEPKLESGESKYTVTFGTMELSNYYNYDYRDKKDTHQSFRIIDFNGETIYGYANRDLEMYGILMDAISNNNTTQFFSLSELHHMDSGSEHMAEIAGIFTDLDW